MDENKLKEALVQAQQQHSKRKAERLAAGEARFYECTLPFARSPGDTVLSPAEAGKTMARCLAKGDMASVTVIVESFIWKLFSTNPPYNIRAERCDVFLAPVVKMAKNLKIDEISNLDAHSAGSQIYDAETLAGLYHSIMGMLSRMGDSIKARLSVQSIRTSDEMVS